MRATASRADRASPSGRLKKKKTIKRAAYLSPILFAQHARKFQDAAKREALRRKRGVSLPAYFLAARAIELALKSYLLLEGHSERQLRDLRHGLSDCLDAANSAGLPGLVAASVESDYAVRWIDPYYREKDLEYPTTGFKSYPEIKYLVGFCDSLLDALDAPLRKWRPPSVP